MPFRPFRIYFGIGLFEAMSSGRREASRSRSRERGTAVVQQSRLWRFQSQALPLINIQNYFHKIYFMSQDAADRELTVRLLVDRLAEAGVCLQYT